MPRHALSLVTLAIATALGAAGCTALGSMLGVPSAAPSADPTGCSPQVAKAYRTQAAIPVGTLEVTVKDASGSPQASVSVTATHLVPTGLRCPAAISATTDALGVVRLERMKTGPYDVRLEDGSATASAQVNADQTTSVTLLKP